MTARPESVAEFERVVLPWLNDAYSLARYLMRDEHDAQDIVQEAFLRALRYFDRNPIENPRAWLLTIVRRTCYTWKSGARANPETEEFDETMHTPSSPAADPMAQMVAAATRDEVLQALDALPAEFREVLILRELQELSYREISQIVEVPIGTVMSRISRARLRLAHLLVDVKHE